MRVHFRVGPSVVCVFTDHNMPFSSIKVITITGLIILGIVLDLGGGPNHDRLGFRYWKHPGPFVQFDGIEGSKGRFLGWWAVMTQAAFSFIGTEIVAVRQVLSAAIVFGSDAFMIRSLPERQRTQGATCPRPFAESISVSSFSILVELP